MSSRILACAATFAAVFLLPAAADAQSTLGGSVPGETRATATDWKPPAGIKIWQVPGSEQLRINT